jgi:hypothetical protein
VGAHGGGDGGVILPGMFFFGFACFSVVGLWLRWEGDINFDHCRVGIWQRSSLTPSLHIGIQLMIMS